MRLRIALLAGVVTLVALSAWLARPAPLSIVDDFNVALATARSNGAWVVVHVRRADRPLGATMDAETLADPEVARRARDGFVHARLDAIAQAERLERLAGPGVALATLVVDEQGEAIAELDGFATAAELSRFLERVRERRAALRDPETPELTRAELVFELGAVTAAERRLAALESAGLPADPPLAARVVLLRGRIELQRGHVEAAREALRATLARYPATPSARDAAALLESIASR